MVIVAGGRTMDSLYMWPALVRLASFPNVHVVPVCSTQQTLAEEVNFGRSDRVSATPAAERCALLLRRSRDWSISIKEVRRAPARSVMRIVSADHRRQGRRKCSEPHDEVAHCAHQAAGGRARS